jgi:MFS family permease
VALAGFIALPGLLAWSLSAVLLGLGTALVYPALLAAVGDWSPPERRGAATGVYRFWRDAGYVAGALVAGVAADLVGIPAAIALVGVLTAASGLDAWLNLQNPSGKPSHA